MSLTFPLSLSAFQDKFPIQSVTFDPPVRGASLSLGGGELIHSSYGPSLWSGELVVPQLRHRASEEISSLMRVLSAPGASFLLSPPHARRTGHPSGNIETSSMPNTIAFRNLPAGLTISAGQFFSFQYGGKRALHQVAESATASGAGVTPEVEIYPPLEPNWAVNAICVFERPTLKAVLEFGSFVTPVMGVSVSGGQSLRWRQSLL